MGHLSLEANDPRPEHVTSIFTKLWFWVLLFFAFVILDFFCCLGIQAFLDHVLKINNETVAPYVSHLFLGAVAFVLLATRRPRITEKKAYVAVATIWALAAPAAWLLGFAINFSYRFTF